MRTFKPENPELQASTNGVIKKLVKWGWFCKPDKVGSLDNFFLDLPRCDFKIEGVSSPEDKDSLCKQLNKKYGEKVAGDIIRFHSQSLVTTANTMLAVGFQQISTKLFLRPGKAAVRIFKEDQTVYFQSTLSSFTIDLPPDSPEVAKFELAGEITSLYKLVPGEGFQLVSFSTKDSTFQNILLGRKFTDQSPEIISINEKIFFIEMLKVRNKLKQHPNSIQKSNSELLVKKVVEIYQKDPKHTAALTEVLAQTNSLLTKPDIELTQQYQALTNFVTAEKPWGKIIGSIMLAVLGGVLLAGAIAAAIFTCGLLPAVTILGVTLAATTTAALTTAAVGGAGIVACAAGVGLFRGVARADSVVREAAQINQTP